MTFRTLLLIGSVSALALANAASAEDVPARPLLMAQAETLPLLEEQAARAAEQAAQAAASAQDAEGNAKVANKEARRAERDAAKGGEAEQQAANEAAARAEEAEAIARAARRAAREAAALANELEAALKSAGKNEARAKKDAAKAAEAEAEAARAAEEAADRAAREASPAVPDAGQPEMTREERRKKRREDAAAEQRATDDPAAAPTAPAATQPGEVSPTGQPDNIREKRRQERQRRREQLNAAPAAPKQDAPAPSAKNASPVEQQIQIQRGSAEVEELRRLRMKLERERKRIDVLQEQTAPDLAEPEQDADDARSKRQRERDKRRQAEDPQQPAPADTGRADSRSGDRRDRGEVVKREGDRIIIRRGDQLIIQPGREGDRLLSGARDVEVEDLGRGQTRTTVYRKGGVKIVTVRDRYGDVLLRTRVLPDGRRIVLIDNRNIAEAPRRGRHYGQIDPLPPFVLRIPREQYIVETRRASRRQIQETLIAPPVERVERAYTLDEVRYSDRLREKVRRVDLDTITFAFGSAAVGLDQLDALDGVGQAIEDLIRKNPDEIFLIEGHTDAVGSDQANLLLSDQRAEAVAVALSEDFDIPPENLVTQGYGEQQLKVRTLAAERENRRVAIRRITPLLRAGR